MGISQGGKGNIKTGEAIEVIGIVPSTRGALFERQPRGSIYVPFARGFQSAAYFFLQCPGLTKDNVAQMADAIRRSVREVDPTLPVLSLKTYPQHVDSNLQLWTVRAGATLFTVFGGMVMTKPLILIWSIFHGLSQTAEIPAWAENSSIAISGGTSVRPSLCRASPPPWILRPGNIEIWKSFISTSL